MKFILLIMIVFFSIQACDYDNSNGFNKEDYIIEADEMPSPVGEMSAIQKKVIYPEEAKEEEIEGTVLVNTFINEKGDVVWTEIFKSENQIFDSAALIGVKGVKFKPGKHKGKNIKAQIVVPVSFKLE